MSQDIFRSKLQELEQEHRCLCDTISQYQRSSHEDIRMELNVVRNGIENWAHELKQNYEFSRSPAVAELSNLQSEYMDQAESMLEKLKREKSDEQDPSETEREMFALYAEFSIDFVEQSIRIALYSVLRALDVQMDYEEKAAKSEML